MKWTVVVALVVVVVLGVGAYQYSRFGYESAPYEVVRTDGEFEIREYPELTVASASMSGGQLDRDASFQKLFNYISGENEQEETISMTTPVFVDSEGSEGRMSFVIPKQVAEQGAPDAKNSSVRIETIDGGTFAVHRFSGDLSWDNAQEAEAELTAWMDSQGLKRSGGAKIAGYDPPFLPDTLRRNEVLIRVAK